QHRQSVAYCRELRLELSVEDDGLGVGVRQQVAQFLRDVPVVDVDGNRAQLERGQHAFEVFDPVVEVQRHVVAAADAATRERVCQTSRSFVGLGVCEPARVV